MNIDQIIGRALGSSMGGEERSALEEWKREAEDNIQAASDMRKIAALSDSMKGYEDFDADEAWRNFEGNLPAHETDNDSGEINVITNDSENKEKARIFTIANLSKIAAVAVIVLGSVFLMKPTADVGFQSQDYAALDSKMPVSLEDGTSVVLDKEAKLRSKDERTVVLKGRAFFDVARDETKQFQIKLPLGEITVLGTEFTVVATADKTEVSVEEGSVAFAYKGTTYTLVAGEFIQVVNGHVERLKVTDDNYSSWKNNRLLFNDNTMHEVVSALSRHFGKVVE